MPIIRRNAVAAGILALASAAAGASPPDLERYIVVLSSGAEPSANVAADLATRFRGRVGYVYDSALHGFSLTVSRGAASAIARDPRVHLVERDMPMSIAAQALPTGIQRVSADSNSSIGIDGADDQRVDADVAVLDTGIDEQHPDLNVVSSVNCLQTTGNGPRWARGYYCAGSGDDDHYHGTHVAGTIGALDNGIGVVGVAPGVRLWAVKVLDSGGSGYTSGIIAGIDWVIAQGDIEVLNMSIGGAGVSTAYQTAIDRAVASGVVVVVAAGNSDMDANDYSPAFVPSAITVSALADFDGRPGGLAAYTCRVDQDDTLADFSNWGSAIDIAAPGVCIRSTYPLEKGEYATISGTSMAAPHVAGAAALLASGSNSPADGADVENIRNTLINAGHYDWTDDSGDGISESLLNVAGFNPTLQANTGGSGTPSPTAFFTTDCTDLSCRFDRSGSSSGTYAWDFGDGNRWGGPETVVQHTYGAGGSYTVTLTVSETSASDSFETMVNVSGNTQQETLFTSSENNGSSWTARVTRTDGSPLDGAWSYTSASAPRCSGDTCSLADIPKKVSSVTFFSEDPDKIVEVLKP